jgi:hypothetical protein
MASIQLLCPVLLSDGTASQQQLVLSVQRLTLVCPVFSYAFQLLEALLTPVIHHSIVYTCVCTYTVLASSC